MTPASHNRTHFTESESWAINGTSVIIEPTPMTFLREIYLHRNSSYIIAHDHPEGFPLQYLPEEVAYAKRMAQFFDKVAQDSHKPPNYPSELQEELQKQVNYDFLPPLHQISGIYDSPITFTFANLVVLDIVYIQATYWLLPIVSTRPPLRRIIIRDGGDLPEAVRALPFHEIEDHLAEMPEVKVILLFINDDVCLDKFKDGFHRLHADQRILHVTEEDIFGIQDEQEYNRSLGPVYYTKRGRPIRDPYAPGLENERAYKYKPADDPFDHQSSINSTSSYDVNPSRMDRSNQELGKGSASVSSEVDARDVLMNLEIGNRRETSRWCIRMMGTMLSTL
ncbi:hypothetical protein BD779DRAFT_1478240 [Infundibulicybe gibba]|nr:hypothetical protein BD779DRAFT_1478240 [Infundibulicybe gibba]